ncbi:MAG: sensor histidine kinase [Candidatus Planktophila sp.]
MKLTSNARLRIVTIAITTILTASIGWLITDQGYNKDIRAIDNAINSTIIDASQSPHQELSAALFHIEDFSLDVSLFLVARDGSITTVSESTIDLAEEISLRDAAQAVDKVQRNHAGSPIRYRSLLISGGDYLVVAASSKEVIKNFQASLLSVAIATAAMSSISFILLTFYTRRLKRRDDKDSLARMQIFLGDASHELRTPLTVIKGYVEMLSKGQMSAEADRARAFGRVSSEIGRMETLIHDLLLLAELGESGYREREDLDLSELLSSYCEDFTALHPQRNVSMTIEPGIHITIARDHLARFIQNSLNNISRHTPEAASVAISLSLNGKRATVIIEDGGEGLSESAYGEKIQSLTRFDPSRSREGGGSGLGMSIMAGVISKAGGELALRKSSLGGLAIVAQLPAYRQ